MTRLHSFCAAVLILLLLIPRVSEAQSSARFPLIPFPQELKEGKGNFVINTQTKIIADEEILSILRRQQPISEKADELIKAGQVAFATSHGAVLLTAAVMVTIVAFAVFFILGKGKTN